MDHLKTKIDEGSSSCPGPYHSALAELAKLDLETSRGAQVRSRARWVDEGESSSAYFFRLEKKAGADRWISAIKLDDGTIVSSADDLCVSFAAFYSSLFTAAPTDSVVCDSLLRNVSSSLSPGEAASCEGLLTPAECLAALQGMAKLAACVIAGRLLKVIHLVVDKDQTCGVPGRFIGENVALLRDVVYYCTSFDVPAVVLSLDQEKAFHRQGGLGFYAVHSVNYGFWAFFHLLGQSLL